MSTSLAIALWLSLFGLLYTFAGYPAHVLWLAKRRKRGMPEGTRGKTAPEVSVVLVVWNEASRVGERIRNLLASDYPLGRLEIVVVSDGSDDGTVAKVREFEHDKRVRLLVRHERSGKPACLNEGIAAAQGEIIVFADARQRFAEDTVNRLAENFHDPEVGAVSGELLIESADSGVGSGVDAYWKLEKLIRGAEAQIDSSIGCTGAVYAIRKSLYTPLPDDTLLDDVVTPMRIVLAGYRVLFDETAKAYDPQSLEPEREARRKRRTLAGNFQMLVRHPEWLRPSRNRLWWQLIAHKYLRLLAPFLLLAMFDTNLLLARSEPLYMALFAGQVMFYAAAIIGLSVSDLKLKVFSFPAGFVFLNIMTLRGLLYYLSGAGKKGW